MNTRRAQLALVASGLVVAVVTTACGSSSTSSTKAGGGASTGTPAAATTSMAMPTTAAAATGGTTIDVKNFSFNPMSLTVKVGTKVTWKFDDAAAHTVKASDGSFSSPALSGGKTYSYTFTKAGTFAYICSIHQYMTGSIIVQ